MARKPKNPQIEQPSIEANNLCKVEFSERVKAALRRIFGLADDENTKVKLYKLEGVSCPRIFWTPICPTGGIHDEVEHDPNRNQRCE